MIKKENVRVLYEFEMSDRKFVLVKPTRKQKEEAQIFYLRSVNELTRQGVLPRAIWAKKLQEGGGTVSEEDNERYLKLNAEYRKLDAGVADLNPDKDGVKIKEIEEELKNIAGKISEIEASQIAVFENSSEAQARNKSITWWVTELCFEDKNGALYGVFGDGNYESKLDEYDRLVEDEENDTEYLQRFLGLVATWYFRAFNKPEQFAELESEKAYKEEAKVADEPAKPEEKAAEIAAV